jgi:hypothetical protein
MKVSNCLSEYRSELKFDPGVPGINEVQYLRTNLVNELQFKIVLLLDSVQ